MTKFQSRLAEKIILFLEFKHSIGIIYKTGEWTLCDFDVNVNIKFTKSVSLIFTSSGCYDHHPQSWISYPLFDMTFL